MVDDWAAVEVADGEMRLWPMRGGADAVPLSAPVTGDPGPVLQSMLAAGGPARVLAAGWPDTPPATVPCLPPAPLPPVAVGKIAVHRLPGLAQGRPADRIGAAATSIAGHMARHPGFDGVLCLPGRATVWAHLSAGEIVSVRSFLTVELLAALFPGSGNGTDGFAEALGQSMARPAGLAGDLSSVRALQAAGTLDATGAHARAAGLLIGAELAAARPWWLGQAVTVVGAGWLAGCYAAALAAQGVTAVMSDPNVALLEGFLAARRHL